MLENGLLSFLQPIIALLTKNVYSQHLSFWLIPQNSPATHTAQVTHSTSNTVII